MKRIRFSKSAVSDLDEIWMYAAERDGVDAAERLIEWLTRRIGFLSRHPMGGVERPDLGPGIRSVVLRPFRVYYRLDKGVVRIVHVRHGAQDEGALVG